MKKDMTERSFRPIERFEELRIGDIVQCRGTGCGFIVIERSSPSSFLGIRLQTIGHVEEWLVLRPSDE